MSVDNLLLLFIQQYSGSILTDVVAVVVVLPDVSLSLVFIKLSKSGLNGTVADSNR